MTTEQIRPQICVFIAAQAALMTVLQEIPTGRQDKPYCLLSLALALTGLTEPLAAMIYGAVCGALCDLLGSGRIGFYADEILSGKRCEASGKSKSCWCRKVN